ncbi:MAG: M1 family metallopeptidase [Nitrososphaerota archaeon]|nr:M1 family metallopeptidase [Nitrososphaerota archaeon]MDG7024527.1 M1 family metallopeptidase [Nitrososphaerota archaeon]
MVSASHKPFILPESRPHYPPQLDFHTVHRKVELALDFEKKEISGACTLEIVPVRPDADQFRLDAVELRISNVIVDGAPAEYEYDNVTLIVAVKPGDGRRAVRVEYSASPRVGVYFTGPDEFFPDKEVQCWTHSEAEDARHWFPCHDHPHERSTSEMVVMVPRDFRVISNGRLLSVTDHGETATYHWKEDVAHPTYLTSFVAGKFSEIEQEVDGIKLRYNFPEKKRADVLRYFGETPRVTKVLGELTGMKYPYEKYDQTTVEDFVAGGEENINATTLAMNYYPDADSEEDFSTTYASPHTRPIDLVAHEESHQWFGDLVTCSDWAHAWLNEGFASYFQELYLERTRGVDEMLWHLDTRTADYFDEDADEYRRAMVERNYVWPDDLFDAHLYPKGASRLHELRFLMGDEAFFKGISSYLKAFANSVADTDDFRKALERSSGLQLAEFFEQAFYKPGHPEFEANYSWDEAGKLATVRVRQVQRTDDGTPVFKLPCEIVFYAGGEKRTFRVTLDSADQTLTFSLPSKPAIVEFDPRRWLLKKLKFDRGLDLVLNQLEGSLDAWSRAEAARELGKTKSGMAVEGLARAAAKDQFWLVRARAFRALGDIGTEAALEAMLRLGMPNDRRVRRGFAEALGNFKGERARDWVVKLLKEDESPYVRCEAALALAKAWPEGALPYLKEAMKVRTPNETLGEACVAAMGRIKGDEVNLIVRESLVYGRATRVRIGALKAIKERGQILDEEVPVLKGILEDPRDFRVTLYAINNVVRPLEDRRFIEVLKRVARTHREGKVRRKALETGYELLASEEASAALTKLKAEVEGLKEENRRLVRSAG